MLKYLFSFLLFVSVGYSQSYVGWPAILPPAASTNIASLGSTNINMTPNGTIWATNKIDVNAQDIAITGTNAITLKAGTNSLVVTTNSVDSIFEAWNGTNRRFYLSRAGSANFSGNVSASLSVNAVGYVTSQAGVWSPTYNGNNVSPSNGVLSLSDNGPVFTRTVNKDTKPLLKIQHGNDTDGKNYEFRWDKTNTTFALNQTGTEAVAPKDFLIQNRSNGVVIAGMRLRADGIFTVTNSATIGNTLTVTNEISASNIIISPQYIDLPVSSFALAGGAAAPQLVTVGDSVGVIQSMGWDNNDIAYGNAQLPHNPATTNSIVTELIMYPHIHVMPSATWGAGATNAQFRLTWGYYPFGTNAIKAGTNTVQVGFTGNAVNPGYHSIISFPPITNRVLDISADFRFKLERIAASSNDISGRTICVEFLDIHVPVGNKTLLGSRQETVQ